MARTLRAEPSALLIAIRFVLALSRQSVKRLQRAAVPASKLAVCRPLIRSAVSSAITPEQEADF